MPTMRAQAWGNGYNDVRAWVLKSHPHGWGNRWNQVWLWSSETNSHGWTAARVEAPLQTQAYHNALGSEPYTD